MKRLWSVLFWSVIAAAFIGPGTVTTAASAGAGFRYSLLWALAFSTLACLLLQEACARLTVVSGRDLGEALRLQYSGLARLAVSASVLVAIVLGCAAYQAGNILGGVAGAELGSGLSTGLLTLASGVGAALLLYLGAPRAVARLLSILVAVMGLAFVVTAWRLGPAPADLLAGTLVPTIPGGSGLLILGLVGTTVVPYNLFLGSALARGQSLSELRFGLTIAVVLGGIVSMGIVVVGAEVRGPFGFEALAEVLGTRLGGWAPSLFAAGLFAAGFSSAVTAPLAAAVTARSLAPRGEGWGDRSRRFRAVWLGVLAVGVGFGLAGVRPVPAILIAQAFNGVLLPLVAIFLLLAVNDRPLMGRRGINRPLANVMLGAVVAVTVVLGVTSVTKALAGALEFALPGERTLLSISLGLTLLIAWPVGRSLRRRRSA